MISIRILLLLIISLSGARLRAEPAPIPVTSNMKPMNVIGLFERLEDPGDKFDFHKAASPELAKEYRKVEGDSVRLSSGGQWFQGILENATDHDISVYLQFDPASHADLGIVTADGEVKGIQRSGWKVAFKDRPIPLLQPTLEVIVPSGKTKILLHGYGRTFSVKMGAKEKIAAASNFIELIIVFFLATFISLGLYNFFIFTRTRDIAYLYYAVRCGVITFLCTLGYNFTPKYFLPDVQYNFQLLPVWVSGVNSVIWLFITRRFLSLDKYLPKKFVVGAIAVLTTGLLLGVLLQIKGQNMEPNFLLRICNPLSMVFNIGVGVFMCIKRYRPAYFYMPATTIYFAGVMMKLLAIDAGVLPAITIFMLAPAWAGALEALLMSFGLGDKYMMYMKMANNALSERNVELNRNLSFMLRKLDQGIFSIGQDAKISSEHSDHLKTIFSKEELTGEDAFELLFSDTGLGRDAIEQIRTAALSGIGEDPIAYELNSHIFPRELTRNHGSQILEVDWQPLVNGAQRCEKMMVVLRDVSSIRALQKETEKNHRDMKIVEQVLKMSIPTYEKFSVNVNQLLEQNIEAIDAFRITMSLDLAFMFRNIHTIKGNARTFGLTFISEVAHDVENYFSDLRTGKVTTLDPQRLRQDIQKLLDIHDEYNHVITKYLKAGAHEKVMDLAEVLNNLHHKLENESEVHKAYLRISEEQRVKRFFPTLEDMLTPVLSNQNKIAEELAKPTPNIKFDGNGIRLSVEMETLLRNIFTQILRNSIDHGIESPEERVKEGKTHKGNVTVTIDASVNKKNLVMEIRDDGAGLNLAALAKKYPGYQTDEQLANLIFQTGVSTAEKVTQISGRGVGMDIIKDLVVKHGGNIELVFTKAKNPIGKRPLKLVLTFPAAYVLNDESLLAA